MPSLVETARVVLEKKIRKCEKFTDGWTTGKLTSKHFQDVHEIKIVTTAMI